MSKWVKIAAIAIAAVAVVILAYALLTPEPTSTDTNHIGMGGHMTYSSGNVGLIAIALVVIVASAMVLVLWQEYEPLPPTMMVPPPPPEAPVRPLAEFKEPPKVMVAPVAHSAPDEQARHDYLVLRLLTGDERAMFKTIVDSGGEALQKDLILKTKMSHAKVSRLLDRLEEKGVIVKERHGSTNKVKIKLDP